MTRRKTILLGVALAVQATVRADEPVAKKPSTLEQDREELQKRPWKQSSQTKDGRIAIEAALTFSRDRLRVSTVTVTSAAGSSTLSTGSREFELGLEEKDGQRVLLLKRTVQKKSQEFRVAYRLEADKFVLTGKDVEELDRGGEWTRKKEGP